MIDILHLSAEQLQGWLHLALGISSFGFLLLGLKILASKFDAHGQLEFLTHQPWVSEDLEIIEVICETEEGEDKKGSIKSFRLSRMPDSKGFRPNFTPFSAGQFMSFQVADDGKTLRSYSLSSCPHNLQTVQVTIKNIGVGSSWFHSLKPQDTVRAFAPKGNFIDSFDNQTHRIYIAGGIGITPIASMILSHMQSVHPPPISLFYGARSARELIFFDLFAHLTRRSCFSFYPYISGKCSPHPHSSQNSTIPLGRISSADIFAKTSSSDSAYFICGPSEMITTITHELLSFGVEGGRIITETFASPTDPATLPSVKATIRFAGQTYSYQGNQNLLSFLEEKGHILPYACRSGVCGSCKVHTEGGEVVMLNDSGLSPEEARSGLKLSCVLYPRNGQNLVIHQPNSVGITKKQASGDGWSPQAR